jgi:hypothetical protein
MLLPAGLVHCNLVSFKSPLYLDSRHGDRNIIFKNNRIANKAMVDYIARFDDEPLFDDDIEGRSEKEKMIKCPQRLSDGISTHFQNS